MYPEPACLQFSSCWCIASHMRLPQHMSCMNDVVKACMAPLYSTVLEGPMLSAIVDCLLHSLCKVITSGHWQACYVVSDMQAGEITKARGIADLSSVTHPLLSKVRSCSASPEWAAEFFTILLWPQEKRDSAFVARKAGYLREERQACIKWRNLHPLKKTRKCFLLQSPLLHQRLPIWLVNYVGICYSVVIDCCPCLLQVFDLHFSASPAHFTTSSASPLPS